MSRPLSDWPKSKANSFADFSKKMVSVSLSSPWRRGVVEQRQVVAVVLLPGLDRLRGHPLGAELDAGHVVRGVDHEKQHEGQHVHPDQDRDGIEGPADDVGDHRAALRSRRRIVHERREGRQGQDTSRSRPEGQTTGGFQARCCTLAGDWGPPGGTSGCCWPSGWASRCDSQPWCRLKDLALKPHIQGASQRSNLQHAVDHRLALGAVVHVLHLLEQGVEFGIAVVGGILPVVPRPCRWGRRAGRGSSPGPGSPRSSPR